MIWRTSAALEELYPLIAGHRSRTAYRSGDCNDSLLICGQAVGLMHEALGAAEIVAKTMREAEAVIKRLSENS